MPGNFGKKLWCRWEKLFVERSLATELAFRLHYCYVIAAISACFSIKSSWSTMKQSPGLSTILASPSSTESSLLSSSPKRTSLRYEYTWWNASAPSSRLHSLITSQGQIYHTNHPYPAYTYLIFPYFVHRLSHPTLLYPLCKIHRHGIASEEVGFIWPFNFIFSTYHMVIFK